jgi:hypothetical protein
MFLNHQCFSFWAETIYVDGCIVWLTWGCATCSRCCVIQTRIRLQTLKLPACSARTSVSTTAKCGRLWSRAGRQTDALHCAACRLFLVSFPYQNACSLYLCWASGDCAVVTFTLCWILNSNWINLALCWNFTWTFIFCVYGGRNLRNLCDFLI